MTGLPDSVTSALRLTEKPDTLHHVTLTGACIRRRSGGGGRVAGWGLRERERGGELCVCV